MYGPRTHKVSFSIVLILSMTALIDRVQAQQDNSRRQFVQSLLKSFIESQLPDEPNPTPPPSSTTSSTVANRSSLPNNSSPLATAQIREAGQLLSMASNEMQQLVGALQNDLFRAPGVRQLLSLAFQVNSDAAVLSRRLAYANDVEALRQPLRNLDEAWNTLEYQLNSTPNLSARTLDHIERIRQYESQLASMFKITRQVNLSALADEAFRMNQSLRNLLEDIRFEITDTAQANQLLQNGRETYDQLQRYIQVTRRTPAPTYAELTREFGSLSDAWARYERQFRLVDNRFVQRQLQRMNEANRNMSDLLYLSATPEINRDDLAHATRLLQRDIDQLLRRVNLKMLSELPAARRLSIDAASDFSSSAQDLLDLIQAGDDIHVLREVYMMLHDEWQRLELSLQGISSQQARQSIRDAEQSLLSLQTQLGVKFDFDRTEATRLAAALLSNAQHIQSDIRDFFGRPNRYSRELQNGTLQAADQFRSAARELHAGLDNGANLRTLKVHCEQMANAWQTLETYLPRFDSSEQAHLDRIRRDITPQMIQMQTLIAL